MAKKQKRAKLPKEIAGIKVPKELRKTANKLIAKAGEPEGRQALIAGAAALGAAATAFAKGKAIENMTRDAKQQAVETVGRIKADLDREREDGRAGPWSGMVAAAMTAALEGLARAKDQSSPPVGEAPHRSTH